MDRIRVTATFPKIPDGNLAEFKKAAAQALESAKSEAGTLQYDWFLNEDETACVAHEEYEDSAALLAHVADLGALFGTLLEVGGGCKFEMFGDPTPELREAVAGLDLAVFPSFFQGK
jgi:quinol monooxygenase YgiN